MMKNSMLLFLLLSLSFLAQAQYAFELKVTMAMRIQNSDRYSISGQLIAGKIEKGKKYFLESGGEISIENLMSSKSGTTVPVAAAPESVSMSVTSKEYEPMPRMVLKGISTRPMYGGSSTNAKLDKMKEGLLKCKVNGRMIEATTVSKPLLIKKSGVLDMFFETDEKQVIWLQLTGLNDIESTPHQTKSDTSQKDVSAMCKMAFMPKGFRPTDMPSNYIAFEDMKGNASILVTVLDRYRKRLAIEFAGILRPNMRMLEDNPNAGLYYITEGRVDNIIWEEY